MAGYPPLRDWIAGGRHLIVAGHSVFVRVDGPNDAAPVTLSHGFPTSSHDWAAVVPSLVQVGFRVVTFDLLGFGASDKPHPHRYRIVDQAGLVEELWSRLGVGRTALVAHDYSVSVAQELLSRDPERITSMTWLNGGLYPDLHRPLALQRLLHSRLGPVAARFSTERAFRGAMRSILGRPVAAETLHEMWLGLIAGDGRRVQPELLAYLDDRRANAQRWQSALESYGGPTRFIWGPADPVSGAHVLPRLRERMPAAHFTVLDTPPAVGHYPQVEAPDEVSRALLEHLGG